MNEKTATGDDRTGGDGEATDPSAAGGDGAAEKLEAFPGDPGGGNADVLSALPEDEVAPLTPAEKKKSRLATMITRSSRDRRISAAVTLMDKAARQKFHINDDDTLMTQVAKLTVLEEEFMGMTASAQELQR